jgi:hypothetical protein
MGELPVLVFTDQFVLPGLVKQEGVDGIPGFLSLSDLLEQAGELQISLRRHLEPVPQPFCNCQPGHHQGRPVGGLLEASDGLIEQDTVHIRIPELRPQGGQVVVRRWPRDRQVDRFACHRSIIAHWEDTYALSRYIWLAYANDLSVLVLKAAELGMRYRPCRASIRGRVAQLARARRLQRRGHRFEPCHAHQPSLQVNTAFRRPRGAAQPLRSRWGRAGAARTHDPLPLADQIASSRSRRLRSASGYRWP